MAALDGELGKGRYFELKMNAFAFEFAADDRLLRSRVYDRCGFPGSPQNALLPLLDSLQAFANHSRFREFFGIHRPFYQSQKSYLSSALDAPAMLTWLRSRFPTAVPFDGYRIVFSPLVGGRQSVTWLESNGYRELQAHVNFPYPVESDGALSPAASSFRRGQIVFTELNHGFINPAADPFRPQIAAVFSDREFWVVKGSSADSYGNALSLFLELMNWALLALYAEDAAPAADLELLHVTLNAFMGEQGRGFRHFPAFRMELLRLYRQRLPNTSVEALYPALLDWCKTLPQTSAEN